LQLPSYDDSGACVSAVLLIHLSRGHLALQEARRPSAI